MSQENVEIVRRVYDAAARRDAETVLTLYDPEVEWDASRTRGGLMGRTIYRGHGGIRRYFREWSEAWERYDYALEELIDGGDKIITVVIERGRGRVSGIEVKGSRYTGVWTIRESKIVRVVWFLTRDEALEAAGLSE